MLKILVLLSSTDLIFALHLDWLPINIKLKEERINGKVLGRPSVSPRTTFTPNKYHWDWFAPAPDNSDELLHFVPFTTPGTDNDLTNVTEDKNGDAGSSHKEDDRQYVLFLEENGRNCTATLIHPRFILTAAHCLEEYAGKTKITYGCTDLSSPKCIKIDVRTRKIHEDYQFPGNLSLSVASNDIALAKLARPIRDIKPIQLPNDRTWIPEGYATVAGYGFTEWNEPSQGMKSFNLRIVKNYGASDEKIFVQRRIGMENGDSGGPLIYNNALYGVASISREGLLNSQLVYINVNVYRQFIDSYIDIFAKFDISEDF